MWADISPDMMSDEEFDDEQRIYIRHPPSYRSTILKGGTSLWRLHFS